MKVLHLITGLAEGGAEQQLRLLVRHLRVECDVAALTNPGSVAAAIRADGVPVHLVPMAGHCDVTVLPRLTGLMRAGDYDLVHTHLYRACVYGRVAARLAGVPHVVATEHSLGDEVIEGRRITAAVRRLYLVTEQLGDVTIAVSAAVAHRLHAWGVDPQRVCTIPNGLEVAELEYDEGLRHEVRSRLRIPADAAVIGTVGRLEPTKQLDRLLRAGREIEGAWLLVVGTGSDHQRLVRLAHELGMSSRVVFSGAVPHPRAVLAAMDVLASPSDAETFGLAVLEGLAAGLPVVYASAPSVEELEPGAAPGAQRVRSEVGELRDALGAQLAALAARGGRRLPVPPAVTHHRIDRTAAATQQLYERLVARSPCPGRERPRDPRETPTSEE